MRKFLKNDRGMLIVEATFVFPIMFLVIFLMIFMGNAYFQRSRVEAIVTDMAFYGAAECADPLLKYVEEAKTMPKQVNYEIEPYRYVLGGMDNIETVVAEQISSKIRNLSTGLFTNMKPQTSALEVKFNNAFIYSTFSVDILYKITVPIKLPGMDDYFSLKVSSRVDVPVSDTPEFIRNVNMVGDWVEATEAGQDATTNVEKIMEKVSKFIN